MKIEMIFWKKPGPAETFVLLLFWFCLGCSLAIWSFRTNNYVYLLVNLLYAIPSAYYFSKFSVFFRKSAKNNFFLVFYFLFFIFSVLAGIYGNDNEIILGLFVLFMFISPLYGWYIYEENKEEIKTIFYNIPAYKYIDGLPNEKYVTKKKRKLNKK